MNRSTCFPPICRADARVLILGSLPGQVSLARQEYYANKGNAFWWIMGELAGARPELAYTERADRLRHAGIALWDVCAAAVRPGSLDANIAAHSVVPNDFARFLSCHHDIGLICFNGAASYRLFCRLVVPGLAPAAAAIPRAALISTSAACTRPRAEKLAIWRQPLHCLIQIQAKPPAAAL